MQLQKDVAQRLGGITRFLVQAGGALPRLAAQCQSDLMGLTAIGASVFIIAVLAGASVGLEVWRATHSLVAAVVAFILWGSTIFTVDRLLLSKMHEHSAEVLNHPTQKSQRWRMAAPRLLMIFVMSFIISSLLLQKVFETSLTAELALIIQQDGNIATQQADAQFGPEIKRLTDANTALDNQVKEKETVRDAKYNAWIAEAEGTAGSRVKGQGPLFKQKETELKRAEKDLEETRKYVDEAKKQNLEALTTIRGKYNAEVLRVTDVAKQTDDILARYRALFRLVRRDAGALILSVMLMLALMLLESTSLTVELISPSHEYIKLLASVKQADAIRRAESLAVEGEAAQQEATSAKASKAAFHEIQQAIWQQVTAALKSGQAPPAGGPLQEVVTALENHLRETLLAAVPPTTGVPAGMTAQPASVLVRVISPHPQTEEVGFKINFNRHISQAHQVLGRDLQAALHGNNLPNNGNKNAPLDLSNYKLVTEQGVPVSWEQPLFPQLGASLEVHLKPLSVPLVNDTIT